MVRDETPKSRALNAWLRSSWLFDGASETLLKEVIDISSKLPWKETKVLLREALALAFQLDDKAIVRKLLNDHPVLKMQLLLRIAARALHVG